MDEGVKMVNLFKQFFKIPFCYLSAITLFCFLFLPKGEVRAQGDKKQPRILIVLDESSSMTLPWVKDKQRYTAAKELIMAIMDSVYKVNDQVEFALRAFGEQYNVRENNCSDSKLEVMFSKNNKTQMALRLDDLHPLGVTPIAYSLQDASSNEMADQNLYYYGLILITDGEESCGGDLCDVVKRFINNKVNYKPYIINLSGDGTLKGIYECLGNYLDAKIQPDIPKDAGIIKDAFKPDLTKIVKKEKPVAVVVKEEPLKFPMPDVVIYKLQRVAINNDLMRLKNVTPLDIGQDRLRFSRPVVAVLKPVFSLPATTLKKLPGPQLSEPVNERYKVTVKEIAVATLKPTFSLPQTALLPLPGPKLSEAVMDPYKLKLKEVDVATTKIEMPQVALQKLPQMVIADEVQEKLRFAMPEVTILKLAPFKPAQMKANNGPQLDTLIEQVRLNGPYGVCVDNKGNIYISDNWNNRIRKVGTDGIIHTIAGTGKEGYERDGVPAISTPLFKPCGIFADNKGDIFFSDRHNRRIRKIDANGIITTVVGTGVQGYNGDSLPALKTQLYTPSYLTKDPKGNMYVSDSGRVWKIDPTGKMSIVAGDGHSYTYKDADRDYVRFIGDKGSAVKASLNRPHGIAVDPEGNVYIVDRGHFRIRKVDTEGIITTIAGTGEFGFQGDGAKAKLAKMSDLNDIAIDDDGNLFFTDGNIIRKLDKEGIIHIIAGTGKRGYKGDGGPARDAELSNPVSLAVDDDGNVYIAEAWNNVIRKVDRKGIITTVAGCGKAGFMGDGLPAASGSPQK